jgi:ParB-like chromosome segregation protein Spo0J
MPQMRALISIAVGPRVRRNAEAIGELAASLRERGLLQPIAGRLR